MSASSENMTDNKKTEERNDNGEENEVIPCNLDNQTKRSETPNCDTLHELLSNEQLQESNIVENTKQVENDTNCDFNTEQGNNDACSHNEQTGNGRPENVSHEDFVEIALNDKQENENRMKAHEVEEEEDDDERIKWSRARRFKTSIDAAFSPIMRVKNPLPEYATWWQKLKYGLMLPPQGKFAHYLQLTIIILQLWGVLIALTSSKALPGGNFFSLLVVLVCCHLFSLLFGLIRLPPLVGMLLMGLILRNVPGVKVIGESLDPDWASAFRKLALTVILTRAGLGLDVAKLKKLSFAVIRLAFTPCLAEAITVSIAAHFLLRFPWEWSLLLGCILGALSPAVTVPLLVSLQDRHYGVAKGIPTMCLAAGGLDNVFCVTAFAVFLGIIFSGGDSIAVTIIKGPLGVLVGIAYGFIVGFLLWFLPSKDTTFRLCFRVLMLLGAGMVAIFGSSAVGLSGAGPLGCLTTATVAAYRWRKERKEGENDEVSGIMAIVWLIIQHYLFGLIGAAVNVQDIHPSTAGLLAILSTLLGLGIATLCIGLCVRCTVSFTVTMGTGFNIKERIFITLTWISKATVQAAIGGLALDRALSSSPSDPVHVQMGTDVLTLAVLAIIICAPIGATCMTILGPRLLVKGESVSTEQTPDHAEQGKNVFVAFHTNGIESKNDLNSHINAAFVSDDVKKEL